MFRLFQLLSFVLAFLIVSAKLQGFSLVKIEDGYVQGASGRTIDSGKLYYAFKGIPFAEPPVGNLRFKPPVPKKPWPGLFLATKEGEICIQGGETVVGSEDCLSVNVYTPSMTKKNLPVMAVIYGGAFIEGKCTYDEYGPDYFLEKDVIVVSFNYRVGVFGFLSTGDSVVPGNNGLKDLVLALKWIQRNIKYFGGDPGKVTILGGSAGGVLVSHLIHSPLTEGIFSGAIMQSGVSLMPWSLARNPAETAFAVGKALGVTTNDTGALTDYLRTVNTNELQRISSAIFKQEMLDSNPKNGLPFAPVIEPPNEEAFLSEKIHELLSQGKFHNVPCIVGFNSMESNFDLGMYFRMYLLSTYDMSPKNLVPVDLNIGDDSLATKLGKNIKSYYFGNSMISTSISKFMEFTTDDLFIRPIREFVRLVSRKSLVYFYRFDYEGSFSPQLNKVLPGAAHSEELIYLWRNYKYPELNQTDDLITRQRLVTLWTNFAKYRNPTPNEDPLLEDKIWMPSNSLGDNNFLYININKNVSMGMNPNEDAMTFWEKIYDTYASPPLDTF